MRTFKIRKLNNKGLSLAEALMTALVFSIAATALLSSMVTVFSLLETSKNQTNALSDVRSLMERVRAIPYANMLADFPHNTLDGPASKRYYTVLGGAYSVPTEHIRVIYVNTAADPLELRITSTWTDRFGRSDSVALSTFKGR